MRGKKAKIEGKEKRLPENISLVNKRGKEKLRVRWTVGADVKEKFFPATLDGLQVASEFIASKKREAQEYGQKFGAITDDEKRAIDLWRAYREECEREGCMWEPISDVMRKALELVRPQTVTPLFPEVSREWLLAMGKKNISPEHLRKRADKERRLATYFDGVRIGNISPDDIQAFLDTLEGREGKEATPRTIQDYMGCIGHIFGYAVKRGIVSKNPIKAMEKPRVKPDKEPETLPPDDARRVMEYAVSNKSEHKYLPGLVLAMFCGVRPAELARLRHVDLFPGGRPEVYLSRAITKTQFDRRAKLRDNVLAWLRYSLPPSAAPDDFVLPGDTEERRCARYTKLLKRLAEGAGVIIPRDALRHTAATMIAALEGMGEAAEELGNDVRTLARHYRHSVPREDAEAFFSILPPPSAD